VTVGTAAHLSNYSYGFSQGLTARRYSQDEIGTRKDRPSPPSAVLLLLVNLIIAERRYVGSQTSFEEAKNFWRVTNQCRPAQVGREGTLAR
jgi:hypothetical protein